MASPGVAPSLAGSYEILALLGTGGMGSVFKARQISTGRIIALKTLQDSVSKDSVKRFQREAKLLSAVQHPNIVQALTFGIADDGQAYLTMEYLEGISLSEKLERDGPLTIEVFLNIFSQVLSGLNHAHQHRVIHRDLKPQNIMLVKAADGAECVKLVDFGIARSEVHSGTSSSRLTKQGALIGTLNYMSPEQFKGKLPDARADIYSLGCVMHEMLTGKPPYHISAPAEAMVHDSNHPEFVPNLVDRGVPAWLDRLIEICLSRDPQFRYQTTALLEEDFTAKTVSPGNEKIFSGKGSASKGPSLKVPLLLVFCATTAALVFSSYSGAPPRPPEEPLSEKELLFRVENEFRRGFVDLDRDNPFDAMKHVEAAEQMIDKSNLAPPTLRIRLARVERRTAKAFNRLNRNNESFKIFEKSYTRSMRDGRFEDAGVTANEASGVILDPTALANGEMYKSALAMCELLAGKALTPETAAQLSKNRQRLLKKLGKADPSKIESQTGKTSNF